MSITKMLVAWIENYDSQQSLGSKLRAKRIAPLLDMTTVRTVLNCQQQNAGFSLFNGANANDGMRVSASVPKTVQSIDMIESVFNKHGSVNIIDIGGTESYWGIVPKQFLDDHHITIVRTELSGYNTVGEEIRIVWMGFNEGWVQV